MSSIRRWFGGGVCVTEARLDGKTVVITGANSGIGKETAIDMGKRGAIVIMACRNVNRGESALKDVKESSGSDNIFLKILDLSSLNSVREFANSFLTEYDKLHILINNAGIMMCPYTKTEDGFESQLGVNHLGHFALTNLLLSRMVESAPGRIVNVSSMAHKLSHGMNFDDINLENNYSKSAAYQRSKLANILFTKELHRRLTNYDVTTYVLHPGVVATEIARESASAKLFFSCARCFSKTPVQGAQTSIYCAVQEGIESESGLYFKDCAMAASSPASLNEEMAKKLWDVSEEMTKVKFPL